MSDQLQPRQKNRLWPVFVAPAIVVIIAAAWTGFWFYSASHVDDFVDGWRAREAQAGRIYDCGGRSVGGYPFRLEIRCDNAQVALVGQTAAQNEANVSLMLRLSEILVVGQIYDPKLIIAEFAGPASLGDAGRPPSVVANWRTARSSVAGTAQSPQRISLVIQEPAVDATNHGELTPIFRAKRLAIHGRPAADSTRAAPVIETAVQIEDGSWQGIHPLLAQPFSGELQTRLRGLNDISPKTWPDRFRALQEAGGRIDVTLARFTQGPLVAQATGALGIAPSGHLEGQLDLTVAGLDKAAATIDVEKLLEGVPQATLDKVAPGLKSKDLGAMIGGLDRLLPGLSGAARKSAANAAVAGIKALGQPATLDGREAVLLPLKFSNGAVMVGPLQVAETSPLF